MALRNKPAAYLSRKRNSRSRGLAQPSVASSHNRAAGSSIELRSRRMRERERERGRVDKKSGSRGSRYRRPFLEMNARSRHSISLDKGKLKSSTDQPFSAISDFFSEPANQPRTQLCVMKEKRRSRGLFRSRQLPFRLCENRPGHVGIDF